MNKREFVTAMKEHMNFDTLAEAEKSIDAFIKTMKAEIKKGNKVDLINWFVSNKNDDEHSDSCNSTV